MPHQDPPSKHPSPPGFVQRTFTYFARGDVQHFQFLLPLCFTQEEEAAQARDAQMQLHAHDHAIRLAMINADVERRREEDQRREQQAQEASDEAAKPGATPVPLRPKLGELDAEAERALLKSEAKAGELLERRSFARAAASKRAQGSQLYAKLFEWDEIMKLIDRAGTTPDRDAHKRNRDLFLRIRKAHPHHMRPVGYLLRDHRAVLDDLARIAEQLPHFAAVLEFVRDHLVLSFARQQPMRIPPLLLLGDPGIGKTHFTFELANALRVPVRRHTLDGGITDSALVGSDKRWSNTAAGLLFEELVLGPSASPVILLDEIDKARSDHQGNALGPLHSLLEPVSAKAVTDISVEITMDASHIVWVATGNEPWKIPAPIRSRMREFMIETPTGHAAVQAAHAVARAVHARMGSRLFDPPDPRIVTSLAHLSARELIQALETGYARALANGSRCVQSHHLPADMLHESEGNEGCGGKQDPNDPGLPPTGGYLH